MTVGIPAPTLARFGIKDLPPNYCLPLELAGEKRCNHGAFTLPLLSTCLADPRCRWSAQLPSTLIQFSVNGSDCTYQMWLLHMQSYQYFLLLTYPPCRHH
jgi:hypothetical protein